MVIHCNELKQLKWEIPFRDLMRDRQKVHVWITDLNHYSETQLLYYSSLLKKAEREKANRLHFERDRRRYIVAKVTLRNLLGRYLNAAPESVKLKLDACRKPYLINNPQGIQFNLSHSGDKVVLAFRFNAQAATIGIDVEQVNRRYDYTSVIKDFFSPQEQQHIRKDPSLELFFKYWTRKEALIKALGGDLSIEMRNLNVSNSTNICKSEHYEPGQIFYLQTFKVDHNYMVSLAIKGQPLNHTFIDYDFFI